MIRTLFTTVHAVLGGVFLYLGIRPYLKGSGPWDAGAVDLFLAFWLFFGAIGFFTRNRWAVAMAFLPLAGVMGLGGFISALTSWSRAEETAGISGIGGPAALALTAFLAAGLVYALCSRRDPPGPGFGATGPDP